MIFGAENNVKMLILGASIVEWLIWLYQGPKIENFDDFLRRKLRQNDNFRGRLCGSITKGQKLKLFDAFLELNFPLDASLVYCAEGPASHNTGDKSCGLRASLAAFCCASIWPLSVISSRNLHHFGDFQPQFTSLWPHFRFWLQRIYNIFLLQMSGYPLSPHIKTIAVAYLQAE